MPLIRLLPTRLLAIALFAVVAASCASSNVVITDGRTDRQAAADTEQRTADLYRRSGAPEAAREAQKRADAASSEANRKYDGFLDWLVDVLFYSWLNSGR